MQAAVLTVALLLVTGLAVAVPSVAADVRLCDIFLDPPKACYVAESAANTVLDYALCFYNTAPAHWADCV
jgi:hypothetical protein